MAVVDDPVVKDDEMRAVRAALCCAALTCAVLRCAAPCRAGDLVAACCVCARVQASMLHGTPLCIPTPKVDLSSQSYAALSTQPALPAPPTLVQIFRRMHAAFVDAVSNPFYQQGAPLVSPRFDASIRTIATSLGAT